MKRLIYFILFIFMCSIGHADTKITELTEDSSPTSDDLVVTVNDPGGTPATRKATIDNLFNARTIDISANTSLAATDPVYLSGDTVKLNTLELSETHLAVSEPIYISGNTVALNTLDVSETHLIAGTHLTLTGNTMSVDDDFVLNTGDVMTGNLDMGGNNLIDLADVLFQSGAAGGTLSTGTTGADKIILRAYDTNAASYRNILELDAGNPVTVEFNEDGIDIDWRVEGVGEANALFVQGSDGNVGIGNSAPSTDFHVTGGARITGLTSCNTIDTDSNGVLSCGTDEGLTGTIDISDQTSLGASDPVYLSGDTVSLNLLDLSDTRLVAGTNITFTGNTISAAGGEGSGTLNVEYEDSLILTGAATMDVKIPLRASNTAGNEFSLTIDTVDISDKTSLSATDPVYLSGDTITLNLLDAADTRLVAGTGITLTGNTFSADLGTSVDISDETNLGGTDPVFVSGDNVALNTLQISDTHIAVTEPIYLTGDTFNLNLLDMSETNFVDGTHLTLTGNTLDVDDDFILNTGDTMAGTLFASNFNLGSDICSAAANGGALTTDANGYVVCEDDDSGAAAGTTDISDDTNLGAVDPVYLSGDTITLNTIDITADTNLGAATPLFLSGDTISTTTHSNIIYVGKHGNDSNDGLTPGGAKLTVASGISAASSGDTVVIFPGSYSETNLQLTDGVNLAGVDRDTTIITGAPSTNNGTVEPLGNNQIWNLTIADTNDPDSVTGTAGVYAATAGVTVEIINSVIDGGFDAVICTVGTNDCDIIIRDSVLTADYDAVVNFGDTGSTIEAYNTEMTVVGSRSSTETSHERCIVAFTDNNVGTITDVIIDNVYCTITTDNSLGDVGGIWLGQQTSNSDAATAVVTNSYFNVTGQDGADAYCYYIQTSSANSTLEVYNTTCDVSGGVRNISFDENAGTITAGNNMTVNGTIDTGTVTFLPFTLPNSTTLPTECHVGEIYMDTDATSGQRLYLCESTDTWSLQGDGTSGGGSGGADVELQDSSVVSSANTMDYTDDFDVTSSGAAEAEISLNTIDMSEDTNWGANDPLFLSGDTIGINTVDISDKTSLAANSPILLSGDTITLDFTHEKCIGVEDLAAADDDLPFFTPGQNIVLSNGWGHCLGTCTTEADIRLEVVNVGGAGPPTAIVGGTVDTEDMVTGDSKTAFTSGTSVTALDVIRFSVENAVSPETDEYTICVDYTVD